jgi:carbamoyltransferase
MKNKQWILGITIAQHDASICLLHGDEIVLYIAEERISKIKHDGNTPLVCLDLIKDYTEYLDDLVLCNVTPDQKTIISNHLRKIGIYVANTDNSNFHHLYHAASAFYLSGFEEAFCLVIDGWGSASNYFYTLDNWPDGGWNDGGISCDETTSIFKSNYPSNFSVNYKHVLYDPYRTDGLHDIDQWNRHDGGSISIKDFFKSKGSDIEVSNHLDIGVMYGVVSSFIGFCELECGKTMGLSSYGKEDDTIPPIFFDKQLKANMNLFTQSRTLNTLNYPDLDNLNSLEKKANLAYAIQKALEEKFEQRIKFIDENYSCKNIVLSGGCAFNVVGNSHLVRKFPHINFFVDPVPHDAGQSIGRALLQYHSSNPNIKNRDRITNLYLGPSYSKEDLKERIFKCILGE